MCFNRGKQDDNTVCTSAGLLGCGRRVAMAVNSIGQGIAYLRPNHMNELLLAPFLRRSIL